jgi:aminoglycoside phosphotransferase (APT) family kinase protein
MWARGPGKTSWPSGYVSAVVSAGIDGRAGIDAVLVKRLVASQFPQWTDLAVTPVDVDGWDNRTYRLGEAMTVRLPTHESYAAAIDKEHRWLPVLAPLLPVSIPVPLAKGEPGHGYPFRWSIRRWLDGQTASSDTVSDLPGLATSVAEFILALQGIDATGGPQAGAHSFYRGASLAHYDDETRRSLAALHDRVDTERASAVWDAARAATWGGPPVWFHGDIASGNLLVRDGRLAAVIDFGTSGVGDPACDLVIAWTLFSGDSRKTFRDSVGQDAATWVRAGGWALWKALITLAWGSDINEQARSATVIGDVLADLLTECGGVSRA